MNNNSKYIFESNDSMKNVDVIYRDIEIEGMNNDDVNYSKIENIDMKNDDTNYSKIENENMNRLRRSCN